MADRTCEVCGAEFKGLPHAKTCARIDCRRARKAAREREARLQRLARAPEATPELPPLSAAENAQLLELQRATASILARLDRAEEVWRQTPSAAPPPAPVPIPAPPAAQPLPLLGQVRAILELPGIGPALVAAAGRLLRPTDPLKELAGLLQEGRQAGLIERGVDLVEAMTPLLVTRLTGLPLRESMELLGRDVPAAAPTAAKAAALPAPKAAITPADLNAALAPLTPEQRTEWLQRAGVAFAAPEAE